MNDAPLIACHECDLLQRETVLPGGGIARCTRCGAELYRNRPDSLNRCARADRSRRSCCSGSRTRFRSWACR